MHNFFELLLKYKNVAEKRKPFWNNLFDKYGKEFHNDIGKKVSKLKSTDFKVIPINVCNQESDLVTKYYNADKINVWRNNITDITNYYYGTEVDKQSISDDASNSSIGNIKNRIKSTHSASYKTRIKRLKFIKNSKKSRCSKNKRKMISKPIKQTSFSSVQFECDDVLENHSSSNNLETESEGNNALEDQSESENIFEFVGFRCPETPSRKTVNYQRNKSLTESNFIKECNGLELKDKNTAKSNHASPMHNRSKNSKRTNNSLRENKNFNDRTNKLHESTHLSVLNDNKSEMSTLIEYFKSGVLNNSSEDENTEKSTVKKNKILRTKIDDFSKIANTTNTGKKSSTKCSSDLKLLHASSEGFSDKRTNKSLSENKNFNDRIDKLHESTQLSVLNDNKSEMSALIEYFKSGVLNNSSGDENTEKSTVKKNKIFRTKIDDFSKIANKTNTGKKSSTKDSSDLKVLPASSECSEGFFDIEILSSPLSANNKIHNENKKWCRQPSSVESKKHKFKSQMSFIENSPRRNSFKSKIDASINLTKFHRSENHDFSTDSSEKSIERITTKNRIKKLNYSKLENQNSYEVSNLINHKIIKNKKDVNENAEKKKNHNSINKSFKEPQFPVLNDKSNTIQNHFENQVLSNYLDDNNSSMQRSCVNKNRISQGNIYNFIRVTEKKNKENYVKQNSHCFEWTDNSWDLPADDATISEILRSPSSANKSLVDNKNKNNFGQTPLAKNNNNVFLLRTSSNEKTQHQSCFKSKSDVRMKNFEVYRTRNISPPSQTPSSKRSFSSDYSEESVGRVVRKKLCKISNA